MEIIIGVLIGILLATIMIRMAWYEWEGRPDLHH